MGGWTLPVNEVIPTVISIQKTWGGPSSAFEKWSGHVEPEGSRIGVFRDLHEKKLDSPFLEAIL